MLPVLERETAMVQNEGATQPADSESDVGLLRRYFKHGDRDAMTQLYKRLADSAYRIAFACTGNAADAEEILQTAFVVAQVIPSISLDDSPAPTYDPPANFADITVSLQVFRI